MHGNIVLNSLQLVQFRNYLSGEFNFTERIVGISGKNGSGKTNLLDAIYYLCFTKSYFSRTDSSSVMHQQAGWRLEGNINDASRSYNITCILRETNRKEFAVNGEAYKKFSDHIGKFPAVMIAPDDVELISGNSEERRKFIDTLLSQLSSTYLQHLISYNKLLLQRNSVLKAAAETNSYDESLLDTLDEQLSEKGNLIYKQRLGLMNELKPLVLQHYETISGKQNEINIEYDSQLENNEMLALLKANRSRDIYLQRTGIGIHKDDIDLFLENLAFKNVASQGQRKSLLFSLKLAEYNLLKKHKGFSPFLLLDDVFEKLDEERMFNLLRKVCIEENAQVFITDTHKERLKEKFEQLACDYQLIELA
jgi:DNA replication and repair protein RecF